MDHGDLEDALHQNTVRAELARAVMSDGLQFFLLGLPLIGFGAYLDLLLMRRHKVRLYDRLYQDWLLIGQRTAPDLARKAATAMRQAMRIPPGKRERLSAMLKAAGGGWFVISSAAAIGGFMDGMREMNPYNWLPIFTVYLVVGGIGAGTLWMTSYSLRQIGSASGILAVGLLGINAALSVAIALLALPVVSFSANYAYINNWPGSGRGIHAILDEISLIGWHVGTFFVDEAAAHFRQNPEEPYVVHRENWRAVDPKTGVQHEATELSMSFKPPTVPVDEWVKLMRSPPDVETLVGRPPVKFEWRYGPVDGYLKDLRDFVSAPGEWQPGAYGHISTPDGSVSISVEVLHLKFVPPWHVVLSTGVIALPGVLAGFVIGALILAQIARKGVAAIASLAIERLAESDPRVDPGRFLPFTVTFVALALCLAMVRLLANALASAVG